MCLSIRSGVSLIVLMLCLASCARLGLGGDSKAKPSKPDSPFGPTGIPPQLRGKAPNASTPIVPGANAPGILPDAVFTPEEDIVFTDPDNPDASLPELSTILTESKARGPWEDSETIAKRRAAREGKPLLIWFTDSARSPMCKALSQELFSTPAFEQWASEKLIRLRVDSNPEVDEPDLSLDEEETRRIDVRNYVVRLKKKYKVLGHPTVIMLNPSGEVIARPRGYKRGEADYLWGIIKHNEAVSAGAYQAWKGKLEKKGYRDWHDRKGRTVFAKLVGYSKGTLSLVEPDGTRSRTHERRLSDDDRAWIDEQKRLRGLQ